MKLNIEKIDNALKLNELEKLKPREMSFLGKLKLIQEILNSVEECWEKENMLGFLRGWIWKEEAKTNAKRERSDSH